jgi:excisionase family DNA binding protein
MEKLTYNVPEVAQLLGISKKSAYDYVRRGIIPSLRLGRRVVIPKKEFEEWLENSKPTNVISEGIFGGIVT